MLERRNVSRGAIKTTIIIYGINMLAIQSSVLECGGVCDFVVGDC